jgi:hypothetical protein
MIWVICSYAATAKACQQECITIAVYTLFLQGQTSVVPLPFHQNAASTVATHNSASDGEQESELDIEAELQRIMHR